MADSTDRRPGAPPRSEAELLDELRRTERQHNGPFERSGSLDEIAARRRYERRDREALLRADLRRFENVRAEHLKWLRLSIRHFRAVLRQPPSTQRAHRLAFARDAIEHNKDSVRLWTAKVGETRAKIARIRRWLAAAE